METLKYKLYASRKTDIIPDGVEFSLIPMCSKGKYILLFADKELSDDYKEIPPDTPLQDEEKRFLLQCKMTVNARAVKDNEKEYTEALEQFATALEKELKAEQEKLKDNNEKGSTGNA